jgi:hypothetical protein
MKLCCRCHTSPRRGKSAYCAACRSHISRQRRDGERAGLIPVSMCKCGQRLRAPGLGYCHPCIAAQQREKYRKMQQLTPDQFREDRIKKTVVPSRKLRDGLIYCEFCGRALVPDQFPNDKRKLNGKKARCKSCMSDYRKEYRRKHVLTIRRKAREYYRKNRERVQAYEKKYRLNKLMKAKRAGKGASGAN